MAVSKFDIDSDPEIAYAINRIKGDYGDDVSVQSKNKALSKFGQNDGLSAGTREMCWEYGGTETLATTNAIDKISSSSASDTDLDLVIEGHTIDSGNLTFSVQTVNFTGGQTETALATPLARCTRIYNNGPNAAVGTIYVYEDDTVTAGVPQTASKVHNTMAPGYQQSRKCATSISQYDYWILTGGIAGASRQNAASVQFDLEIRQVSSSPNTFRTVKSIHTNQAGIGINFKPYVIVPKNHDMRVMVTSSANTTGAFADLYGYLAKIKP